MKSQKNGINNMQGLVQRGGFTEDDKNTILDFASNLISEDEYTKNSFKDKNGFVEKGDLEKEVDKRVKEEVKGIQGLLKKTEAKLEEKNNIIGQQDLDNQRLEDTLRTINQNLRVYESSIKGLETEVSNQLKVINSLESKNNKLIIENQKMKELLESFEGALKENVTLKAEVKQLKDKIAHANKQLTQCKSTVEEVSEAGLIKKSTNESVNESAYNSFIDSSKQSSDFGQYSIVQNCKQCIDNQNNNIALRKNNESLRADLVKVENKYKIFEQKNKKLESTVSEYKQHVEELEDNNRKLNVANERLLQENEELKVENESLNIQLNEERIQLNEEKAKNFYAEEKLQKYDDTSLQVETGGDLAGYVQQSSEIKDDESEKSANKEIYVTDFNDGVVSGLENKNLELENKNKILQKENERISQENEEFRLEKEKIVLENDELRTQNEELQKENSTFAARVRVLEKENAEISQKNREVQKNSEKISDELDLLKQENKRIRQENDRIKLENKDLNQKNNDLSAENKVLGKKNDESEKKNLDLVNELNVVIKEKNKLQQQYEELSNKYADIERKNIQLNGDYEQSIRDNDELKNSLRKNQALTSFTTVENEKYSAKIRELKEQISKRDEEILRKSQENESLTKNLQESAERFRKNESTWNKTSALLTELAPQVKLLREKNENLTEELSGKERELNDLQAKLEIIQSKNKELQQENKTLKSLSNAQNDEKDKTIAKLQNDIDELNIQNNAMQEQADARRSYSLRLTNENRELREGLVEKERALLIMNESLSNNTDSSNQNTELLQKNCELLEEIERLRSENNTCSGKIKRLEQRNEKLSQENSRLMNEKSLKDRELVSLYDENKDLKNNLEYLEHLRNSDVQGFMRLEDSLKNDYLALDNNMKQMVDMNYELEEKLKESNIVIENLAKELNDYKIKIRNLLDRRNTKRNPYEEDSDLSFISGERLSSNSLFDGSDLMKYSSSYNEDGSNESRMSQSQLHNHSKSVEVENYKTLDRIGEDLDSRMILDEEDANEFESIANEMSKAEEQIEEFLRGSKECIRNNRERMNKVIDDFNDIRKRARENFNRMYEWINSCYSNRNGNRNGNNDYTESAAPNDIILNKDRLLSHVSSVQFIDSDESMDKGSRYISEAYSSAKMNGSDKIDSSVMIRYAKSGALSIVDSSQFAENSALNKLCDNANNQKVQQNSRKSAYDSSMRNNDKKNEMLVKALVAGPVLEHNENLQALNSKLDRMNIDPIKRIKARQHKSQKKVYVEGSPTTRRRLSSPEIKSPNVKKIR